MANVGWGHVLASAVGGYLKGSQMARDQQDADEDRAYKREQRLREKQQWAEDEQLRDGLRNASGRAEVVEGALGDQSAGPPVSAAGMQAADAPASVPSQAIEPASAALSSNDSGVAAKPASLPVAAIAPAGEPATAAVPDSSPVLAASQGGQLAPNAAPLQYRVVAAGGQNQAYGTRAEADAAAQKYNAPDAIRGRRIMALEAAGKFDRAAQLESSAITVEAQRMHLADQHWKRGLGNAMGGGHDGLASFATRSEAGPMAGLTVKAIPSADGKTVTYASVGKDGAVSPIPGLPAFTNDANGVTQAAWMLDRSIDPQARMAHFTAQSEREQKQSNWAADHALKAKEVDSKADLRRAQAEITALRYANAQGGGRQGRAGSDEAPGFNPLSDFDPKQARKEAMEIAGREAEATGKRYSEQRAQEIYSGLRDAAAADNTNRHVRSTVSTALRAAAQNPAAYASAFGKAQQVASVEQLGAWGFKPPAAPASATPAAASSPVTRTPPVAAPPPANASAGAPPPDAPAPGSKVARMRERNEQMSRERETRHATDARDAAAQAQAVVSTRNPRAAYRLLQAPGFGALPIAVQHSVSNIANGRGGR